MWDFIVSPRVAVASVARGYHHVTLMPERHCALHGYAVYDSSIEHRNAVYADNLADVWKTARRTHYIKRTLAVGRLGHIHGASRETVGRNHLERMSIFEISVVIKGYKLVWETVVEQHGVEDAALRNEVAHTYIIVFRKHINIRKARPTLLAADI